MRLIAALTVLSLAAVPALAQTPLTGTTGAPTAAQAPAAQAPAAQATAATARRHATLQERFDEANVTHDGRLTPEQARAKMPAVARDFEAIDADHDGTVTVAEIKAHAAARRAARKAAKAQ